MTCELDQGTYPFWSRGNVSDSSSPDCVDRSEEAAAATKQENDDQNADCVENLCWVELGSLLVYSRKVGIM